MDSTKVMSLLEALDDEIDDLEESLEPLLKSALSETASKLPLLDKAKLYVLVTYAIESMLFSYLRLHGVNAREHPVFKELTRVKQYFDKIKAAETPAERTMAAGNDKYDLARAEQIAKENAKAHVKFNDLSKEVEKKRKLGQLEALSHEDSESSDSKSSPDDSETVTKLEGSRKQQKLGKSESKSSSGASTPAPASKKARLTKKEKKAKQKAKKDKKEKRLAGKEEKGDQGDK
ncbi:exosome-associated family protein [Marssonina coronariae]|uniref:Exosome complex protein n=1 Tax=Diplocarpon coronariae TaxID=2795749 RepID=A0A218ZHT6_9HELO|nr:exosome-associated family protein [Marssonina coronariae]